MRQRLHQSGGTQTAIREAEKLNLPTKIIIISNIDGEYTSKLIAEFLQKQKPNILNIAGPRESEAPGIGKTVRSILEAALLAQ